MQCHEILSIIQDALECTQELDNTLVGRNSVIANIRRINDPHRGHYTLILGVVNKDGVVEEWELESSALNRLN